MLNSSLTRFIKVQSDYKLGPKLVAKVKYPFKIRTDISRFLHSDRGQNILRHFVSISVSSYLLYF